MGLKNLGLPTVEIEGINSIKVSSRLLDQLRSRAVVEGCEGAKPFAFLFADFFSLKYQGEIVSKCSANKANFPLFLGLFKFNALFLGFAGINEE